MTTMKAMENKLSYTPEKEERKTKRQQYERKTKSQQYERKTKRQQYVHAILAISLTTTFPVKTAHDNLY